MCVLQASRKASSNVQVPKRVYTLGIVPAKIRDELQKEHDIFEQNELLHFELEKIMRYSVEYTTEVRDEVIGVRVKAVKTIPYNTVLAFCTGRLDAADQVSKSGNYKLAYGRFHDCELQLDFDPSLECNLLWQQARGSLFEHSCKPNCVMDTLDQFSCEFSLLTIRSDREIQAGEYLSYNYKGTFWKLVDTLPPPPPGFKVVFCSCTPHGVCPNRYARHETL